VTRHVTILLLLSDMGLRTVRGDGIIYTKYMDLMGLVSTVV